MLAACEFYFRTKTKARSSTRKLIDTSFTAVGCPEFHKYIVCVWHGKEKVAGSIARLEKRGEIHNADEGLMDPFCTGQSNLLAAGEFFISFC